MARAEKPLPFDLHRQLESPREHRCDLAGPVLDQLFQDRLKRRILPVHSFFSMVVLQGHGIPEWAACAGGAPARAHAPRLKRISRPEGTVPPTSPSLRCGVLLRPRKKFEPLVRRQGFEDLNEPDQGNGVEFGDLLGAAGLCHGLRPQESMIEVGLEPLGIEGLDDADPLSAEMHAGTPLSLEMPSRRGAGPSGWELVWSDDRTGRRHAGSRDARSVRRAPCQRRAAA
ncbi:hypothetical protein JSE7799_01763 [Jannaschia seosinensis]|uniref:Uncharacterized protein n=1 Tax=Jannaschia seosinensis TaxID=313367 RepID=A0A0M7BB58_9RHOB|nr:hypothetical protein JSE7799_01763 [Jannaschia seosinensis]